MYEDPIVLSRQPGVTQEVLELGQERAAELGRLTATFVLRRTAETNKQYLTARSKVENYALGFYLQPGFLFCFLL